MSLKKTASAAAAELSDGVTVQILEANPDARARQAEATVRRLQAMPQITSVHLVPQSNVDALVEPWLGKASSGSDIIPIPALIDARLNSPATTQSLEAVRKALQNVAPAARVDAQSSWLKPVFDALQSLQWMAAALVVLLAFAMASAVLLAVRSALGTNRDTIEIVHLLGGTDRQIAGIFQRTMAMDAVGGGLLGLVIGLVAVLFLGQRFASLGAGLVDSGSLGWMEWAMLAAIPLAAVALATLTARVAVLRALRRLL
jgi:cell division transport system permease protein